MPSESQDPSDLPVLETLDDLASHVERTPDVCVRYSNGPDADRDAPSVDYESGLTLPGLSCTPLRPEEWWTRDVRDWLARQVCHYVHLKDADERRGWLLVGDVAGYGPDREPLLAPWRPVAWLSDGLIDEARRRYEQNFDVGNDSSPSED